jgi:hypothetical protein
VRGIKELEQWAIEHSSLAAFGIGLDQGMEIKTT